MDVANMTNIVKENCRGNRNFGNLGVATTDRTQLDFEA